MTKIAKISKTELIVILSLISAFFMHSIFFDENVYNLNVVRFLSLYSIVILIILSFAMRKAQKGLTYMNVWLIIAYLFYFGQFYCYLFGVTFDSRWGLFSGGKNSSFIILTFFYSIEALIIIVLFFIKTIKKNATVKLRRKSSNYGNCINRVTCIIAKLYVFVCIIPTLIYKLYAVYLGINFDYATMKYLTGSGMMGSIKMISYFSGWLMPMTYMWMVSTQKKSEQKIAKIIVIIYAALVMLSGSRYEALEVLVAYILLQIFWFKNFDKRKIIVYFSLFVIVIVLFSVIRSNRVGAINSNTNQFVDMIFGDSGPAASINYAAIKYTYQYDEFAYGLSYIYGVISVLPSAIKNLIFPNVSIAIDVLFTEYLGVTTTNLGSSFLAEAFYNFGWFSLLFVMPAFGYLFGNIVSCQIKKNLNSFPPYIVASYIYLCSLLIFVIRSDFSAIIRTYIIYSLIPILIVLIVTNILYKKNKQIKRI